MPEGHAAPVADDPWFFLGVVFLTTVIIFVAYIGWRRAKAHDAELDAAGREEDEMT